MNIVSLSLFVIITTFTPGPNNISCASFGMNFGYRKTLPYMMGILSGFLLLMLACAVFSFSLKEYLAQYHHVIRWIGAAYIGWLSRKSFYSSYSAGNAISQPSGFRHGFML